MTNPTIGIIGGSGLYEMAELSDREERTLSTPFGDPSGPYVIGTLRGTRVAFLARHGAGHRILPSELNFRANIYGFKVLGVERGVPVNLDVRSVVTPTIDAVAKKTVDYIAAIAGRVGPYPPPVPLGASEFEERAFRPIADKLAFGQLTPADAAEQLVAEAGRILKG